MGTAQTIAIWENEGGALGRMNPTLVGTEHQIAWAEQIRVTVDAEFDRVQAALESVAARQTSLNQSRTRLAITILEEKRGGIMDHRDAGYFIKNWQDLRDQVRLLIIEDARYTTDKRL